MATLGTVEGVHRPRIILGAFGQALYRSLCASSMLQAQAVAYVMFLAFFPTLIFLAGLVAIATPGLDDFLEGVRMVLPSGSRRAVVDSLLRFSEHPTGLLGVGAVGTLLLGSQFMASLSRVFANIYDREKLPSFWNLQARSIAMVVLTLVPLVAMNVLVVFGKNLRSWLVNELGVGFDRPVRILWTMGYFSLVFVTAILALGALYYFLTPNHRHRWPDVLPGAALAMSLWWIVATAFGIYVRRVAIYDILYGGFAAAIGLLIWMYLSALVILIGARFNRELGIRQARYASY